MYHEESGGETTFPGWRPADWVSWMLDRLGSAPSPSEPTGATSSLVSMEIIDARLVRDPAPGVPDDTVAVDLRLRINGMADLNRTLAATVAGVLFGCDPPLARHGSRAARRPGSGRKDGWSARRA